MKRRSGFTLIEMMVVIIIIVILAGTSVALMNTFFKGQGVRQGAMVIMQAVAQAKQAAAETHIVHFLVFAPVMNKEGWLEIHKDNDGDGRYMGDFDPLKAEPETGDPMLEGHKIDLPKFVIFEQAPQYIAFQPSGYATLYKGGSPTSDIQASVFDGIMNALSNAGGRVGDIIIRVEEQPYWMCLDLDRASGKIRRHFFVTDEK